jgi:hypothetical protein
MRQTIVAMIAACAITAVPRESEAQSENAFVGWIGLVTTPVGAFTPYAPAGTAARGGTSVGVQARYSHWQFAADDDNTTNVGAGLVIGRGALRTAIELGRRTVKDCDDCASLMGGLDMHVGLLERALDGSMTLGLAINPALGFGQLGDSEDDVTSLAGALSVPISLAVRAGSGVRVIPFVSPGFGLARLSGDGESSTGSRAMLSGGLALAGVNMPVQLTASARKIFMEEAPTVLGVGVSIGR